jgi:FkbM family methyltransferase
MAKIRRAINRAILNKLGYHLFRSKTRVGQDPFTDMRRFVPSHAPTIFDVGANLGQTACEFRKFFPQGKIHCFEPGRAAFDQLVERTRGTKDLHRWNCALGASAGQTTFFENSASTMSSILPMGRFGWGTIVSESTVNMRSVDEFCDQQKIDHIDILKSDTQGYDLEVFRGAEGMIRAEKIGLVYTEVTFSELYKNLPRVSEIYDFLIDRDFSLVALYEFRYQKGLAAWTDVLFIHKSYRAADSPPLGQTS